MTQFPELISTLPHLPNGRCKLHLLETESGDETDDLILNLINYYLINHKYVKLLNQLR